jgi:hypothetical protein
MHPNGSNMYFDDSWNSGAQSSSAVRAMGGKGARVPRDSARDFPVAQMGSTTGQISRNKVTVEEIDDEARVWSGGKLARQDDDDDGESFEVKRPVFF